MKKLNVFGISIFTIIVVFMTACTTPQKLYENGNSDEAISLAVEKMRARKVKPQHIEALVEAFNYINQRDMDKLTRLRAERNPETWSTILDIATNVSRRQELVKPLLAMDETKYGGKLAALHFDNTINFTISEARDGAAAYLYEKGNENLNRARNGERLIARTAYNDFTAINSYFKDYKDTKQLVTEAYNLGINHVFCTVENQSNAFLSPAFTNVLQSIFVRDFNTQWVKFHTVKDDNLRYEYTITAKINQIDVSPERFDRRHSTEEARVDDGYEYVLDGKGNVKKDTLGNDIKTRRFKTVRADVFEIHQRKEAQITGFIEYFDNRTKERVLSQPIKADAYFNYTTVRFEGDRRALCEKTCRSLGNSPARFPSDEEMILSAMENLKHNATRFVRNNDYVLAK